MFQAAADAPLDDWFQYTIGAPVMDLTAAPYGGARYSVETRMDGRVFAKFHLDAGIDDIVIQPLETVECPDWLGFAGIKQPATSESKEGRARKRIALFRSLFRGREDVYARRWEHPDAHQRQQGRGSEEG
jgi:hypothetical protein